MVMNHNGVSASPHRVNPEKKIKKWKVYKTDFALCILKVVLDKKSNRRSEKRLFYFYFEDISQDESDTETENNSILKCLFQTKNIFNEIRNRQNNYSLKNKVEIWEYFGL